MGKYDPLAAHLRAFEGDRWTASFDELEAVLGASLPQTARGDATWWTVTAAAPHVAAWSGAGWSVAGVDVEAGRVTFLRDGARPEAADSHDATASPKRINAAAVGAGLAAGAVSLLGIALALRLKRRG